MKKIIVLTISILLITVSAFAQFDSIVNQFEQEFDEFQQQIDQEYQNFSDKNDSIFAQFLEDSWEEFDVFYNEKKEPPKPVVQPSVKTEVPPEPVEIQPVPPDSSVPEFSPPEKLKQPEKLNRISHPKVLGRQQLISTFTEHPQGFQIQGNFHQLASLIHISLESEINTLHVVFSEKKYFKSGLNNARHDERNYIIPKSLSRKKFEEWMAGNKTSISDFLDYQIHIEILGD
ncbi:MAG: hypothetical protein ACQERU_13450 [Bacteroidota bacterium]